MKQNKSAGVRKSTDAPAKELKKNPGGLRDGASCQVTGGVHAGQSGTVRDIKTGKTGHVSITVVQANGERFKTLARNVVIR